MGTIVGTDRNQIEFTSLDMLVKEDSVARIIDLFIENVVMEDETIHSAFTVKNTGRPKYPDSSMLKLYIYGYLKGIRSSRKLEEACEVNVEVKWLMNSLHPDFRTISDFRKDNIDQIVRSFRLFNDFCRNVAIDEEGNVVYGDTRAVDGTKIRANQSKDKVYTANKIDDRIEHAEMRINQFAGYLDALDQNDRLDDGGSKLAVNIPDRATVERKLEFYKRHLEELKDTKTKVEQSGSQYSETDRDARLMKNHYGGYNASYNVQAAVDSNSHMIENFVATNDSTDHGKLYDSVKDLPGVTNAIADNGYNQKEDLADCLEGGIIPNVFPNTKKVDGAKVAGSTIDVSFVYEENGITEEEKASSEPDVIRKCLRAGVVPEVYKDQLELKPEGERFEIEREYEDATGDEYVDDLSDEEKIALAATGYFVRDLKADKVYCPRGVILRRKSVKKDGSVRYCNKLRCGKCSCQCFKESRTTRWKEVDFKNGQRLKPSSGSSPSTRRKVKSETKKVVFTFYPDQGKLDRRKCLSEHPFGTIKRYQNGDHFLLRTLDKIKGEVALMFLGYNIKRLCSLVSPTRVMAMLDA